LKKFFFEKIFFLHFFEGMFLHKFGRLKAIQRLSNLRKSSPSIHWKVAKDLHFRPTKQGKVWNVFAQGDLLFEGGESKLISTGIGFASDEQGVVIVSLHQQLIVARLSVSNEAIRGDTNNIQVTVQNHSAQPCAIDRGEPLFLLSYYK